MNYLLIGPAWVGDMVMAHCLVQRIAQSDSAADIQIVAPSATAAIAERMAEVARVHTLDVAHGELGLGARWRLGRRLAQQRWDQAFVLPNSWKSALVPVFARAAQRTGWLGEARYGLLNDTQALPKERWPLMIERFMALTNVAQTELAKPYPSPQLAVDEQQQAAAIARFGLTHDARRIALCPGAQFGPAKQWPAKHFAAVASRCVQQGYQVWLLGGPADRAICREIGERSTALLEQSATQSKAQSGHAGVVDLAGETDLPTAVDLLAAAAAVVANDSGLMHVACAVDTPVVAVYGSTSPEFTPPLHDRAQVVSLVTLAAGVGAPRVDSPPPLACQPCFQRDCRYAHTNCLHQLPPAAVLTGLARAGLRVESA